MLLDYNAHIELFLTYRKCYVSRMMYLYVGKEIKGTLETRKEEENKNDWGREGERSVRCRARHRGRNARLRLRTYDLQEVFYFPIVSTSGK